MLSTKVSDKDYLRTKRGLIINYLRNWHTLQDIQNYLSKKGLKEIPINTIEYDIINFKRIGLNILPNSRNEFRIADDIEGLQIPAIPVPQLVPSFITKIKLQLSSKIKHIDHSYFDLIDLGFDSQQSMLFELRIVELLNLINDLNAIHLSGGNRPEIIAYSPRLVPNECVIMDSKAYGEGFNIPISERDKMIRYINEYNHKDPNFNSNKWWENFKSPDYPQTSIRYSFVSGNFIGKFLTQIDYIFRQTKANGSAITPDKLIEKAENVLNPDVPYDLQDFFNDLGCNGLVK